MKTAKYIFYTLAALALVFYALLFWMKKTYNMNEAVESDHLNTVVLLWMAGADVNQPGEDGETPLITATKNRNPKMVDFLLFIGADVNQPGGDGSTPLMWAVQECHSLLVEMLLKHGADINARDVEGRSALHYVDEEGFNPCGMVAELLEHGAEVYNPEGKGCPALAIAARFGDVDLLQTLLDKGASPDSRNTEGAPALVCALWNGKSNCMRILLEKGAAIPNPQELLWHAANDDNARTLKVLLDHGVRYIPVPVEANMTALQCAALQGREEALLLLLKHQDGSREQRDEDIDMALLRISGKDLPVIKAMLEKAKNAQPPAGE